METNDLFLDNYLSKIKADYSAWMIRTSTALNKSYWTYNAHSYVKTSCEVS
jgi:hypothetical protein